MSEYTEDLRFLNDISTNILIKTDITGHIYLNNRKAGILSDKNPLAGKKIGDIFNPVNTQIILTHIYNVINTQISDSFVITHHTRQYRIFTHCRKEFVFLCMEDITEKKDMAEHLQATYRRLNFAERTAKLGYWEFAVKEKKIFWSAEMFRIFGIEAKTASLKKNIIREQTIKEDLTLYKSKLRELIRTHRPVEGLIRIRRKNKSIAHCLFKAELVKNGSSFKIAGTFQDLTQLIEIQLALNAAKARAEELNKAKSYFLAQASHDLRQPMQALAIFISALQEEAMPKDQKEIVDKIEASATSLRNLLDNLLDISKLESGGTTVRPVDFNLCRMLKNIVNEYTEIARRQGIKLKAVCGDADVRNDPILVERIVRNFLSNALKYAKSKILIGIKKCGHNIQIRVWDNGEGISPQEIPFIFNEFYQSKEIKDNFKKGSGLGLSIVKKISDLIKSPVSVTSVKGKGSCFILELEPIKNPAEHMLRRIPQEKPRYLI